jgi:hypothetical protein
MSLLLAAALAAQIHTGADLLAVCERQSKVCDVFIRENITGGTECLFTPREAKSFRSMAVDLAKRKPDARATEIVWRIPVAKEICPFEEG